MPSSCSVTELHRGRGRLRSRAGVSLPCRGRGLLWALRWLHDCAHELHFPRQRIAVAGESGGGCLAAGLALLARDRGEFPVSAQFLMYPMLDDRTGTRLEPEPLLPATGEFVWTRESNRFAWASLLGHEPGTEDVAIYAAPGRTDQFRGLPPATILIGQLDLFLAENLRFIRSFVRDGVPIEFHVYPGAYHGFTSFGQQADVSRRALQDFYNAMERHFANRESGESDRTVPATTIQESCND